MIYGQAKQAEIDVDVSNNEFPVYWAWTLELTFGLFAGLTVHSRASGILGIYQSHTIVQMADQLDPNIGRNELCGVRTTLICTEQPCTYTITPLQS